MGACVSTIMNACKEIFLCAIPSTQLVPDSEETAPSGMASTSSSSENASGCVKYQVFINHRRIDTKDSLARTIYHTLELRGVRAFFDREELEAGKEFSHDIGEAIRSASIHVAIFSPKYAESRWCLHELTLMRRTGKKIIPIFYKVKPSVLRVAHGRGDYFKAFKKHEKRYTAQELDEWKTALSEASYIKGYEVNEREKDEGRLVEKIVEDVEEEMKKMAPLHVAKYPVGLSEVIEDFQNFVETRSQCAESIQDVKIVGIVGLGGCGKTTLAAEYFNQERSSYRESSFLFDVKSVAAKNSLHDLQKQLLRDLVHIENAKFHDTLEGKRTLEHRVRYVRALIVFDDVDHISQIEALLPLEGNFQTDGLIIVTTSDSGVITCSASLSPSLSVSVYKKGILSPVNAKQLFCWHAFRRDSPANGFDDLVNQFSNACQGLPLSLKVLGAQLCGHNNRDYWESLFHKISKILPQDVEQRLKERLPLRGIIAATGSSLAYHSRHYCNLHYGPPFEECMQLLGHSTSPSRRLMPSALGLQLLLVRGDYLKEEFAGLSEELVWLRWYDFWHEKLPPWLSTGKLRVLELYQSDRFAGRKWRDAPLRMFDLWGPNDPPPLQLRELIIECSSSFNCLMIPETIGSLKHLKKIVVSYSPGNIDRRISSLPEEFCLLESLEHLELGHFEYLSSLPTNFGKLRKLKYIDLYHATRLAALPVSFNQVTELQYLDLTMCSNLQIEKDILENITKLEIVRLSYCSKLQQLPSGITRQRYLRELVLSHSGLTELPADIGRLARLELLEIGAYCLVREPDGCPELIDGVKYLPKGFGQLVNLQNLKIDVCPIRELPLANPEERYSKKPTNHVVSSMFKFPRLKRIDLRRTKVSTISISEDCCPCLEDLYLFRNHDLMEIKALPTTLKRVDILHCQKLESIRGFAGLVKLQGLEIKWCPGLFELSSFADLVELQRLKIYDCPQLHKLPSFAGLVELRDFSIVKCPQSDELPSFACCTCLQELSVQVSDRITQIEGLEELRSLERLSLETSWKVPGLKGLKNLDKLTTLLIRAESRSAIETCIPPNIVEFCDVQKRACKMGIVGRAVEDVESVVGSLTFPNFTVVDNLHRVNQFGSEEQQMVGRVSNASCVIVCFVISCRSQKKGSISCHQYGDKIGCYVSRCDDRDDRWDTIIFPLEGKQVYIGVYPKCFHLEKDVMKVAKVSF